ncbi:MAG: glutamate--cysteine ligase, partial [Caulobacterales bacterium]
MSTDVEGGALMRNKADLAEHLASGCKPKSDWRIGTEHEKFVFRRSTLEPVPYEGPYGIQTILQRLTAFDWEPVVDEGKLIGLKRNGASISLEPGGQFELSGAPLLSIHETCAEVGKHLSEIRSVCENLNIGFLGLGFTPNWRFDDVPIMPKPRYRLMRDYMPKVGTLGRDMMFRTCTVQANMDFSSEADMIKKFRVSLALQPIATALFANSPFTEGKPNGFLSLRSHIWTDTDNARAGMLPFVFDRNFGFDAYVDYALDVPMYFVKRGGHYVNATGQSFRAFMDGKLPVLPGERPTEQDWVSHLS